MTKPKSPLADEELRKAVIRAGALAKKQGHDINDMPVHMLRAWWELGYKQGEEKD